VNVNIRNWTPLEYIHHGLYFYFSGLSLKRTSERPSSCFIKEIRFLYIAGFKNTTIEIRKEEEGYQLILLYAK
jgi:hypothetical protein